MGLILGTNNKSCGGGMRRSRRHSSSNKPRPWPQQAAVAAVAVVAMALELLAVAVELSAMLFQCCMLLVAASPVGDDSMPDLVRQLAPWTPGRQLRP